MNVVFIGSDPQTIETVTQGIRLLWPSVIPSVATTVEDGLELVEQEAPDMVLIETDLEEMILSEALQRLRQLSNVPIVLLHHNAGETGGLGFLNNLENQESVPSGRLLLNYTTREVLVEGQWVKFSPSEFRLLDLMVENQGIVLSHQFLEDSLWGDMVYSFGLVKKYIQQVRRKLGDDASAPRWITSVHGVGYRFIGSGPKTPFVASGVNPAPPEPWRTQQRSRQLKA